MEDEKFCLRLLALQVQLAHATQLLEGLVDVSHSQALPGVVGHPSLPFTLGFLLWIEILILGDAAVEAILNEHKIQVDKTKQSNESLKIFPLYFLECN